MSDFQNKVRTATIETLKAYSEGEGAWQIAYSGGKDSSVNASVIFRAISMIPVEKRTRKLFLTTASTGLDFTTEPTKQRELEKMRRYIEEHSLPIEIVEVEPHHKDTFPFKVLGMGYPLPKSKMNRWCTEAMKIKPMRVVKRYTQASVVAMGVRLSETNQRRESIESHQKSHYHGKEGEFYPIIDFTLDDIWEYAAKLGYAWGDAEEVSQLYKDATGECGLRKRNAGADEKTDDPCGARFGCVICPVVTIDKSTQEMAKRHPQYQPFVELRDLMIAMYKVPKNKAGRMRNGKVLSYGQGTFTVKARMELYQKFKQAEEDHRMLCKMYGVEPQSMFTEEIDQLIKEQWIKDLQEKPWLEDAEELGLFYEEVDIHKVRDSDGNIIRRDIIGYQIAINTGHDSLISV